MGYYRLDMWQEPNKHGGQTVSIGGVIIVVDVWHALCKIMLDFLNGY